MVCWKDFLIYEVVYKAEVRLTGGVRASLCPRNSACLKLRD